MKFEVAHLVACLREMAGTFTATLTPIEKSQYLSTVVGTAIGSSLYMPSAAVDIPRNFFLTTHGERVNNLLGSINELYPINIDLAASIASNVYLARYRLVFEAEFAVHMLGHLATCSDDVVPKTISDILVKVSEANDSMALLNTSRAIVTAVETSTT